MCQREKEGNDMLAKCRRPLMRVESGGGVEVKTQSRALAYLRRSEKVTGRKSASAHLTRAENHKKIFNIIHTCADARARAIWTIKKIQIDLSPKPLNKLALLVWLLFFLRTKSLSPDESEQHHKIFKRGEMRRYIYKLDPGNACAVIKPWIKHFYMV